MAFNIIEFTEKINGLFEGKSQTELVEMLEISQTMVSALKKGKIQSPGIDTVYRIAEKFNVSVDWLLGLAENPTTNKATKELCATLGLSDMAITFFKEDAPTNFKSFIELLIQNHIDEKKEKIEKGEKYSFLEILSDYFAIAKMNENLEISFSIDGEFIIKEYDHNSKFVAKHITSTTPNNFVAGHSFTLVDYMLTQYKDMIVYILETYRKDSSKERWAKIAIKNSQYDEEQQKFLLAHIDEICGGISVKTILKKYKGNPT